MKDFSSYGYMQGPILAMIQEDLIKMGIHQGTPSNKRRSKVNMNTVNSNTPEPCGIFGKSLPELETRPVPGQAFIRVPRLLLRSCNFLSHHLEMEGLFRKSGSLSRQKSIRSTLNEGNCIAEDSNPHDVASLLKQFLRELPEPLLTHELYSSFIQSQALELEEDKVHAVLLLVLCLPDINRHTLQFLAGFLHNVSEKSDVNKMTASNLAVVIAPNIIRGADTGASLEGSNIKMETTLVETLIQNSNELGLVPEDMSRRAHKMILELSGIWGVSQQEAAFKLPLKGKRKRSGSLSGILTSVFKQTRTTRSKHATTSTLTSSSTSTLARPCTSSTLPRKSLSNQDLSENKTKSVPINGDLSFSTPCIRTPTTRPPPGTPLLSIQRRTALLRQTPVDPRKRPGKQQPMDYPSPVDLDPPNKRSKLDMSPDLTEKRKNFKQRLSEGLTSRYRKSRLKRKLRSRAHCSSESSAVVANAVAMATPEATPVGSEDKKRKERTPVFCFKAKPGSFNDQNRRLAANIKLDSPIQPELIEFNPDIGDSTPVCGLISQQKKLFPSPRLADSPPEDLQSIVSPEQCFNRKYSNEPGGFNVPRRSARLLRRSAPVSGSNTQLSERTPVLRRSARLSGGEPTFPGLSSDNKFPGMPSRSVSGSSYTAKRTSVSLDASNITPKTFSGTSKKFNISAKSYTGSVFSSTSTKTHQPFSPIKVSLNNIQGSSVPEDDLILGTPPTLLGSFSAATPTFVAESPGGSGVGSSHGSEDRKLRRSEEIHSDTTRQDAPHLDTSRQDTSRLDMSQLDTSIDAIPDCTANLTELFTTRDITRLDMSLGVNELDNNFCKQLAAQSPNPNLVLSENEGVTEEVIPNRADENSSYVLDESEWSKNGSVCMNDTTHITYITQNSSTSFLPGNTSCQIDTDTSRTDYPKFGLPAFPPEVILSTSERRKIFPDFPSLSAENTPTNSARSTSSSLQSQFTLLTTDSPSSNHLELLSGLSSQSGSTNTLVASSSTQSGSTTTLLAGSCPSSSMVDIPSEPSGLRSPPEVERVVAQASRNSLMRQSIDAKLSQFSEWIDSSTKTPVDNTEASQTPSETNRIVSRLSGEVSTPTGPGTPLNLPEQHRTGSKEAVVVNSATNSIDSTVSTNSDTNLTPSGHVVQDDQISSTVPGSPNKENTAPTTRRTPKSSQELDTTKINITPRTKISKGFTKNLANQWENMNRDDAESSTARKARKTRIPVRTTSTRSVNTTGSSPPRRPQRAAKSRPQLDDEKPASRKRPTVARATSAKTSDKPNRPISRTKSDNLGKSNTSTRPAWRF